VLKKLACNGAEGTCLITHVCETGYCPPKPGLRTHAPLGESAHGPEIRTAGWLGAGGAGGACTALGPQSAQSVPYGQSGAPTEPGPPSSHWPLLEHKKSQMLTAAGPGVDEADGTSGGKGGGDMGEGRSEIRGPQSAQSVPNAQPRYSAPMPPSSHHPSLAHSGLPAHVFEQ
jgi:hypothetical protein